MPTALHRVRVWVLAPLVSVPLTLVAPQEAMAQLVATSFEELQALVKSGDTIEVTDVSGRKTKGRLGELSASSLELLVRTTGRDARETFVPQRLPETDVRQILLERSDPPWKGTLIGAAVVGGPWLLLCNPATDWCEYGEAGAENLFRVAALITTAIGAGVGALIDLSIKERRTVYYQTPSQQSSGLRVSPLLWKSAAGIQMSMRF